MPILDFDFVYLPEGQTEFRNAHITLDIVQSEATDHCYEITIVAAEEISQADLAKIIEELEQKRFKKMNINVAEDCKITVTSAERRAQ